MVYCTFVIDINPFCRKKGLILHMYSTFVYIAIIIFFLNHPFYLF